MTEQIQELDSKMAAIESICKEKIAEALADHAQALHDATEPLVQFLIDAGLIIKLDGSNQIYGYKIVGIPDDEEKNELVMYRVARFFSQTKPVLGHEFEDEIMFRVGKGLLRKEEQRDD
jgi:hypothetical protein